MSVLFSKGEEILFFTYLWFGCIESAVNTRNIALRKTAYQSSTQWEGWPEKAVDGGLSLHYGSGSCTHTEKGASAPAYWEVDLGAVFLIGHVTIYNRIKILDRLRDVELYIGVDKDHYQLNGFHQGQVGEFYTFYLEVPVSGRWVRITRLPTVEDPLTLCEVEVYEYFRKYQFNTRNIALEKTAYQSSTQGGGWPGKAVDGGLSPYYSSGSCTHTEKGASAPAYWEVDLGHLFLIGHVTIYNRIEILERLRDVELYIGVDKDHYQLNGFHQGQVGAVYTFYLEFPVSGRWVQITRLTTVQDPLTLCEVQVYEYPFKFQYFRMTPNVAGNGLPTQTLSAKSAIYCSFLCLKSDDCVAANYLENNSQCFRLSSSTSQSSADDTVLIK